MKHLATIQTEFLKEARDWDDLTLEEQKGYLKRHPATKRKITAKPEKSTKSETKPDIHKKIKDKKEEVKSKSTKSEDTAQGKLTPEKACTKVLQHALDDMELGRYKNKIQEKTNKDGKKFYEIQISSKYDLRRRLENSGWKKPAEGNTYWTKDGMSVKEFGGGGQYVVRPGLYVFPSMADPDAVSKVSDKKQKDQELKAKKESTLADLPVENWPAEVRKEKGREALKKVRKLNDFFDAFISKNSWSNDMTGGTDGVFYRKDEADEQQSRRTFPKQWEQYDNYKKKIKKLKEYIAKLGWYSDYDGSLYEPWSFKA
jgi:hypothetical protein